MSETLTPDICVIGAGSGGLSVAVAAAAFGVSVVLVEKGRMGGDCLNYGCVPSKALIAAAHAAETVRRAPLFGVAAGAPEADFQALQAHVQGVIAAIAPNDSAERLTGLNVRVIKARARFVSKREVEAGEARIKARRFVIATGSSPVVPPIPGIEDVGYFTNETIFDNAERPRRLAIVGGGPIGMEIAQAHARLGVPVTVIDGAQALAREDPELSAIAVEAARRDGVELVERAAVSRLEPLEEGVRVHWSGEGGDASVEASHLLVATGRRPNVDGLGLEAAHVRHDAKGIAVKRNLKTSNRRVYAIGDVAGLGQFTHLANHHAGLVIRNALFRIPVNHASAAVPRVTYMDPEIASVGLSEAEARDAHKSIRVLRWPLVENDRAQTERRLEGAIKVVTTKGGKILGAGIVGAQAGELIQIWSLALAQGLNIRAMAGYVAPYPTRGEISKRVAIEFLAPGARDPRLRKLSGWLRRLG
jgi:pyruvate/2-oxoglutarate dehydrogenase complex dihydrolipoamide dehydrogenase (E3) component